MPGYEVWLIAKSVLIEAVRRKEIYAIVLISSLLIGAVMTVDFFELEGLSKFYREIALKVMSVATGLTVIVLAARQLPREFEKRTIYPLLAKPISRFTFLGGKLLGIMLSAVFCFGLFMMIYIVGTVYLGGSIPWLIFVQYIYLQLLMMLILATLSFWLSLQLNLDAAITIGILLFGAATTMMTIITYLYDFVGPLQQMILTFMVFAIPQLTLFDVSDLAVHGNEIIGTHVPLWAIGVITIYGLFWSGLFYAFSMISFRRRPL